MLTPHFRIEQVSRFERNDLLDAIDAVVHVHNAIHHSKDFLPIVDVPDVGLIGPVQANTGACERGNVKSVPRSGALKLFASNDFHANNRVRNRKLNINDFLLRLTQNQKSIWRKHRHLGLPMPQKNRLIRPRVTR